MPWGGENWLHFLLQGYIRTDKKVGTPTIETEEMKEHRKEVEEFLYSSKIMAARAFSH